MSRSADPAPQMRPPAGTQGERGMLLGDTLVFLAPMALEQELGSAACGCGFGC